MKKVFILLPATILLAILGVLLLPWIAGQAAPQEQTTSGPKWNAIAMPLDATNVFPNAQTIANEISGTQVIMRWNESLQRFDFWYPAFQYGTNFTTSLGDSYMVQVDDTAPAVFSVTGDVPPPTGSAGALQFNIAGDSPCKYTSITIPLDHANITNAQGLSEDIGNIEVVLSWNVALQRYDFWYPAFQYGTNFSVNIGYPYMVCATVEKTWP